MANVDQHKVCALPGKFTVKPGYGQGVIVRSEGNPPGLQAHAFRPFNKSPVPAVNADLMPHIPQHSGKFKGPCFNAAPFTCGVAKDKL